jgi:hypothetical protein
MPTDPTTRLAQDAFNHFTIGVGPLENWASIMVNPHLKDWPNLRGKAFIVWFGTVLDYLESWKKLEAEFEGLKELGRDMQEVADDARWLKDAYQEIAGSYGRDDQIYLVTQRNRIVHGRLDGWKADEVVVRWYCGELFRRQIPRAEFLAILEPYYAKPEQEVVISLLNHTLKSEPWAEIFNSLNEFSWNDRIDELADRFFN